MTKPKAIGYLRRDVSGVHQQWHEYQMRSLASRYGYDYAKTLAFGPEVDRPVHRIRVTVSRIGAEAVFTPSKHHFDGEEVPAELVQVVDVVTADSAETYARRATGAVEIGGERVDR
ncbi:hypothetical protein JK358_13830 [Nocardia sp. 2]|uniref:Uncharacterized protein n=1 Tax=Nocardia acididurans TaxID=2802282 RepID=A0ABS1M6R3_9NOCA|nr:hypothetical protein [Nocardia acididurans]MBL1075474.1 hypothetical protein [Nocardia acididurans]